LALDQRVLTGDFGVRQDDVIARSSSNGGATFNLYSLAVRFSQARRQWRGFSPVKSSVQSVARF
jgi:hypothetical protein